MTEIRRIVGRAFPQANTGVQISAQSSLVGPPNGRPGGPPQPSVTSGHESREREQTNREQCKCRARKR
eukprot:14852330-Alexandrium_andersonii.AAC.1